VTKLEGLENFAYQNDIDIVSDYAQTERKGYCMTTADNQSAIFLNDYSIHGSHERTSVLAVELGHIQTGALLDCESYLDSHFARWVKLKNKILAKRWAFAEILPAEQIQAALNRCPSSNWELAESLGVSEEFLQSAMTFYIGQGVDFRFLNP